MRIFRWEAYPELSGWTQYNHQGPYKREAGVSEPERDLKMLCRGLGRWRKRPPSTEYKHPLQGGKGKEILCWNLQKEHSHDDPPILDF